MDPITDIVQRLTHLNSMDRQELMKVREALTQ
jgi:hypothetical protein